MRKWILCSAVVLAAVVLSRGAFAADDEQALFDDIRKEIQAPAPGVQGKTPEEAQKALVTRLDGLLAKCEDYRKKFPAGAHLADICLMQTDMYFFLATRIPGQIGRLDKIPEAVKAAVAVDPKAESAMKARLTLVRYDLAKQTFAKTPGEGAPYEAAAVAEAEAVLRDFPKGQAVPAVLDFLAMAYDRAGRAKDSAAMLDRLVKDFPGTPMAQKAERTLKQRAIKGAVLELNFKAVTGEEIDLKNYRGKVVLVDFWATWCEPCKRSLPGLLEVEKKFRDQGFRVIGISLDQDKSALEAFVKEQGMGWPQSFDGQVWKSPMVERYFISGIPTTFLIDKSGTVREISLEGSKLADAVKKLLDEPAPK